MSQINQIDPYQLFCFPNATVRHKGLGRRPLTEQQQKVYNLARVGWKRGQIAKRIMIANSRVHDALYKIRDRGWTY